MDTKQTKFTVIEDPGHAWLVVPMTLIRQLGIFDRITSYSFIGSEWTEKGGLKEVGYLEEDCDAGVFIRAWEAAGNTLAFHHKYVSHFDRKQPRFPGRAA